MISSASATRRQDRPSLSRRRFLRRQIVSRPSTIGLRSKDEAGKLLLILGQQPHARAENVAQTELFQVVVAQASAAAQEDDQRQFSAWGRTNNR